MQTEIPIMNSPETRFSLIGRLRDHDDEQAWNEFALLYQPLIFRIARSRGLQHADAAEVTQDVLGRVAGAVEQWTPDPAKGSFRGWLYRITRNLTIDYLRRDHRRPVNLDFTSGQNLDAIADPADPQSREFETEFRRSLFELAAAHIKGEFQPRTWQAFWRSAVEGVEVAAVAAELEMTVGAVYIARSRVMKRLSAEVTKRNNDSVTW
jgi:RNA polymerase sigma-70 factor (ECF subfamily)